MAMSLGGENRQRAEMNVTPLIDVLLVLIIIFMVVLPPNSLGLDARIPAPPLDDVQAAPPPPPSNEIVITVLGNQRVELNQQPMTVPDLALRLKAIFGAGGTSRVVFIRGDKDLAFREVAEVIDIAKGSGMGRIALMTK